MGMDLGMGVGSEDGKWNVEGFGIFFDRRVVKSSKFVIFVLGF